MRKTLRRMKLLINSKMKKKKLCIVYLKVSLNNPKAEVKDKKRGKIHKKILLNKKSLL